MSANAWQRVLNGLDLFSGIGGITLALAPWVKPIAYCERERHAQSVLLSRMASGDLPIAPIWDDVETLDAGILGMSVDIIYGGFPCQDISAAGRGRGLDGERSGLVFEILRLTLELEPQFVFLENVPAIRTRGGERVGKELAGLGYDLRWGVLSAFDVGAPHLRHRWFALACRNGGRAPIPHGHGHGHGLRDGRERDTERDAAAGFEPANDGGEKPLADELGVAESQRFPPWAGLARGRPEAPEFKRPSETLADRDRGRCEVERVAEPIREQGACGREHDRRGAVREFGNAEARGWPLGDGDGEGLEIGSARDAREFEAAFGAGWWQFEPDVGRVAHGIPFRVDRLRGLGNSVVPAQAREAFKRLAGFE